MTYAPVWTNSNEQGRLDAAVHFIRISDAVELSVAVNRRYLLTYQNEQDFSSQLYGGAPVGSAAISSASAPPFDNLRDALAEEILDAPAGGLGGDPATPSDMQWLWPEADDDEDKVLVSGAGGVGSGQVGLFQKLNGTDHWTDPALTAGQTAVRSVHFNELRQAAEWIRRGRWTLPVYFAAGLFSPLSDTPWIGETIANNGANELRSLGFAILRTDEESPLGLADVTVRASSFLELTADVDCTVEVYHCLRPVDFSGSPPTWNEYNPAASAAWASPGGTGQGDSTLIGSIGLSAGLPGSLSNSALAAALQAMVDGDEQNVLIRRGDTGWQTIAVTGRLVIEFDLDSPPN
ncbi:MAG: hypothetical protein SVT52_02770 [Planctomycetota bacterium]|nr:hypothetical protein [Planctomycetota bacterium]